MVGEFLRKDEGFMAIRHLYRYQQATNTLYCTDYSAKLWSYLVTMHPSINLSMIKSVVKRIRSCDRSLSPTFLDVP